MGKSALNAARSEPNQNLSSTMLKVEMQMPQAKQTELDKHRKGYAPAAKKNKNGAGRGTSEKT